MTFKFKKPWIFNSLFLINNFQLLLFSEKKYISQLLDYFIKTYNVQLLNYIFIFALLTIVFLVNIFLQLEHKQAAIDKI